jgi:hypothetical protein
MLTRIERNFLFGCWDADDKLELDRAIASGELDPSKFLPPLDRERAAFRDVACATLGVMMKNQPKFTIPVADPAFSQELMERWAEVDS